MAILFDPLNTNRIGDKEDGYPWCSGWDVYDEHSITSLNKTPINVLLAYILSEFESQPIVFDIDADHICESLLVDGSIVIAGGKLCHSDEWQVISPVMAYQINDEESIYRLYSYNGTSWDVNIYTNENFIDIKEQRNIATEELYLFPNGEGILKPVQWTYKRLEEIEISCRQQTTEAALSLIITGYEGVDELKTRKQIAGGAKILFIPTPDTEVTRVASSEIVNYLGQNFMRLLPLYFKSLNIPITDGNIAQSGISKQITLQPTLRFCNQVRLKMQKIFTQLDGSIEFKPIIVLSVDERLRELELLRAKRDIGALTESEFIQQARLV